MRPGAEFFALSHLAGAPTAAPVHGVINGTAHSAWQSPVPYLFGGLAAMLGLIAFALLILACSYWKLSGFLDGDRDGQAAGADDGEKCSASGASKPSMDFQEHVVVIMAGDERPTFLAKPVTSRAAEAELAAATAASEASARAGGDGHEKKADEQGCEVISHLGADSATPGRDHHDAAGQSRDQGHDAASRRDNHHHDHEHDLESSSTTALQENSQ